MENNYDFWKTLLKSGTYTIVSTAGTVIVQMFQEGIDIKQAIIVGVSIGIIAGFKNVLKNGFGYDLDLTKLKN